MLAGFTSFDLVWVMGRDYPDRSTLTLAVNQYFESFRGGYWAYGSAIAVILGIVAFGVTWMLGGAAAPPRPEPVGDGDGRQRRHRHLDFDAIAARERRRRGATGRFAFTVAAVLSRDLAVAVLLPADLGLQDDQRVSAGPSRCRCRRRGSRSSTTSTGVDQDAKMGDGMLNSALYGLLGAGIAMFIAALAAYGLTRIDFRGKNLLVHADLLRHDLPAADVPDPAVHRVQTARA